MASMFGYSCGLPLQRQLAGELNDRVGPDIRFSDSHFNVCVCVCVCVKTYGLLSGSLCNEPSTL